MIVLESELPSHVANLEYIVDSESLLDGSAAWAAPWGMWGAGGEGGGTVAVCPLCIAVRWAETDYALTVCSEKKQTRGSLRVVENAIPNT